MTELISSHNNPLVKQIRSLRQRKGRNESGLFLVEGIHHVGEAVSAGWLIDTLVYAPDQLTSEYAGHLVEDCLRQGTHCIAMTTELFSSIAEKDNPQGLLAIIRQKTLTFADPHLHHLHFCVALVTPQDPGNVGTILRSMDATGADGLILLDGGVDPHHPSCVRASMGTIFWKPFIQASFEDFDRWRRANGFLLVGSSAHASLDYRTFHLGTRPTILLLGSEQKGLSDEQMAACDINLCLPMLGRASSLNLAVAASVLLYALLPPQPSNVL